MFKVGDRVKCVDHRYGTPFSPGEVLVVDGIHDKGIDKFLHLAGVSGLWFVDRFVKVQLLPAKRK